MIRLSFSGFGQFSGANGELFNFHRIGLSGTIDDSGQGMITEERLQEFLGDFVFAWPKNAKKK